MEEKTNTFENPSVNTNTYNSDLDQKLVQIMSELQKQTEILRSIDTKRLSENVEAKEETKELEISEVPATDEMTLDPISFPDDQLPVEPSNVVNPDITPDTPPTSAPTPAIPTGDVPEEQFPVYPTEPSVPVPTDVPEPSAPTEPVVPTLPEIPTEEPVVEEPVLNPVLEQTMELPTEEIKEDNNVIGIDELLSEVPTNELPTSEEIKPDVEIAPVAEPVAAQAETQEITWPTTETTVIAPVIDTYPHGTDPLPVEPTIIDKPEQITVEPTPVVAPATPVAPTAPVEPVQPAMPVEPVAPVAPAVPAEPVIPQAPVATNNVELVPNPFGEGSVVKAEGKQRSVEVDNTKINGKEEAEEIKPAVKTLSNNQ